MVLNCIANMTFLALQKEKGFDKLDRKKNISDYFLPLTQDSSTSTIVSTPPSLMGFSSSHCLQLERNAAYHLPTALFFNPVKSIACLFPISADQA